MDEPAVGDRAGSLPDARSALQAARVGAFEIPGAAGVAPVVDAVAKDLFGFAPGVDPDVPDFLAHVHADDRGRIGQLIDDSFASGTGHYVEYRVVHPSGEVVWLASRAEFALVDDVPWLRGALLDITERRQAQDAARLRAQMLDAIDLAVIATDLDGHILFWNRYAETMYGWSAREVLGRRIQEVTPALNTADQAAEIMAALATGKSWQGHFDVRRRDGTTFVAHVTNSPVEFGGRHVGIIGVSMDVTRRHRVEEALRRSETLFRGTFDNAAVGMALVALDGRLLLVNDRFCQITGHGRDQLTQMTLRDVTHPDDVAADEAGIEALLAGTTDSQVMDTRYVRPDGSVVWVRLTASLVSDDTGTAVHVVGVVEDITARLAAEGELRRSELRFRTLTDTLPNPVWVHGPDGRQEWVNDTYCRYFGVSREQMRDQQWRMLVHPDDEDAYAAEFARCVAERTDFHAEIRVRDAAGRWRWMESWGRPRFDTDGTYLGHIGTSADVTDRKAAEDSLRRRESEQRRERTRAEFLAEVLGRMETAETMGERVQRLLESLVPRFADAATVESPRRPHHPVLGAAHRDPAMLPVLQEVRDRFRGGSADGDPAWRAAAGHEVLDPAAEAAPSEFLSEEAAELRARLGPQSHMAVPLHLGDHESGALLLGRSDSDLPRYTEDDLALVRELADRAGVLLARARLRDEEHRIAVRLQGALLPDRVATVPGVVVAAVYESASAVLEVGGDWYDSYELPGGRVGLAVGDVVGHGLESAASMGRMRAALAALAPGTDDPGDLLDSLDEFALGPDGVAFATASYAVLDPRTGALAHASAGHPHALVVAPDGSARFLAGGRSWPLGIGRTSRAAARTTLLPGSLLLMYSDGLVERREEPISEGMARLRAAGEDLAGLEPAAACERLVDVLVGDRPRRDDLVVLAACWTGRT